MGPGSQKFRSFAGRNKMRMVRSRMGYMIDVHDIMYIRFKLFLEPMALRDSNAVDPRLPRLPVSAPPVLDTACFNCS